MSLKVEATPPKHVHDIYIQKCPGQIAFAWNLKTVIHKPSYAREDTRRKDDFTSIENHFAKVTTIPQMRTQVHKLYDLRRNSMLLALELGNGSLIQNQELKFMNPFM